MRFFKKKPKCSHSNMVWTNIGKTTKSAYCPDCGLKISSSG